jgi:excisionase family DNA binding protein
MSETVLADVKFLTVKEIAGVLRCSKMTVYRLVQSGEMESVRVGRSFRVPEQAVNAYLKGAVVGAAGAGLSSSAAVFAVTEPGV